jgi:TolB-like protein/Flp pilus assembly protein TadD/predicted Ser/Thr protein kinase
MECPNCSFQNPDDSHFCVKCATPLPSIDEISVSPTKTIEKTTDELTRGDTFVSRYEVIEELGKGGMGNVYRVFDKKLDEEVALKIIKPEIAYNGDSIDRFSNELKFARKVAHRNVCKMYDLGEKEGTHYITMEYVPGESLNSMIGMMGQLSAAQVVFIAKQMCEGLAEAHRLGVVHRDLKPSNILVDREGNARILDFGLACSLKAKSFTGPGVMIGTPAYMSPEQVDAKQVDKRSDIYSLGVILYEMIAGRVPFNGDTALSIALKHKTEKPLDPIDFNAQMPLELNRVILKCMEKSKEKRYQDAKELLSDLSKIEDEITTAERAIPEKKPVTFKAVMVTLRKRWMMIAAFFAVIAVAGMAILYSGIKRPMLTTEATLLVVLPFENLGPPGDEYFADGITEEITSRLAALHGLAVISRTSAKQYKKTDMTTQQIGEELGADYVLEGAVRWDRSTEGNGRVRVTPQLIRVSDDTHLWAERYDRVINDIFSVQSEIADEVAKQLDLTVLKPERRALYEKPTENLEAYDYYLKGKEHEYKGWSYSDDQEFDLAIENLEKATELDPNFAFAYVQISLIHSRMYFFGDNRTTERLVKSRNAVDRALELQPDLPEAQLALAFYHYWGLLDYDRAEETFEAVQKAQPNSSPELLGYILRRKGKWEQSLPVLEKAFKLNPRHSQLAYEIGLSYQGIRSYEKAEEWFNRALSLSPKRLTPSLGKIGTYVLSKGNTKDALGLLETLPQHQLTDYMRLTLGMLERNYQEVLDRLASLSYDSFEGQHFYFHKDLAFAAVYHAMKEWSLMKARAESARTVLEEAVRENPGDPRFHASLGLAYAYLGRKAEAVQEGNHAVKLHPVSKDAVFGPSYILNLARIYTVIGEYEEAINQLEYLLSIPSAEFLWQSISIPLLRLDPQWNLLREYPKYQRLLQRE